MNDLESVKFMEVVTSKLIKTYQEINEMCKDKLNQNIITNNFKKQDFNQTKDSIKDKNQTNNKDNTKKQDELKLKNQLQNQYANNSRLRNTKIQESTSKKNQSKRNGIQKIPQKKMKKDQQTQPTGNGFMIYYHQRQKQLTAKRPEATAISISKQITQEWQLMDPTKKAFYAQSNTKPQKAQKVQKLQKPQSLKQNMSLQAGKKMKKNPAPIQQKSGGRKAMNYDSSQGFQDGQGQSFNIQSDQSMEQVGISQGSD